MALRWLAGTLTMAVRVRPAQNLCKHHDRVSFNKRHQSALYRPMPQQSVFVPQRVKSCWIISCFTCNRHHAAICSKEYSCLLGATKFCGPAKMKHRL